VHQFGHNQTDKQHHHPRHHARSSNPQPPPQVWVVVLSNLIAIQLQTLAARLGLVTGKNLAQVRVCWGWGVWRWDFLVGRV
jgi:hypothetical protein